jgi:hypothetical protein
MYQHDSMHGCICVTTFDPSLLCLSIYTHNIHNIENIIIIYNTMRAWHGHDVILQSRKSHRKTPRRPTDK